MTPTVTDPQGWEVRVLPGPSTRQWRISAVSPEGKRVIHTKPMTAQAVEAFNPVEYWACVLLHRQEVKA